jgi:hypothetical protein
MQPVGTSRNFFTLVQVGTLSKHQLRCSVEGIMENTSGQGATATVPVEVDRWNWEAFLLNWIWGIGNHTFVALLMFVPLINIVMPLVLGAKGSSWAWRNKRWESVEQFKATQSKWAKWSLLVYTVFASMLVRLILVIAASLKSTEAFKLAVTRLEASQEAFRLLGKPISTGFPMGSIEVSGPSSKASLSFSVTGPNGKGTIFMDATKDLGQWKVNRMVLEQEASGHRIDINFSDLTITLSGCPPGNPRPAAGIRR